MSENQKRKPFNSEKTVFKLFILTATKNTMNNVGIQVANFPAAENRLVKSVTISRLLSQK